MHRSTLAVTIVVMALLTAACEDLDSNLTRQPEGGGESPTATITAANAGVASAETTVIIDTVNLVASAEPLDTISAASIGVTVPCSTLGYGGSGTVTATGMLRNPGDRMEISFSGCTLADAPIAGTVEATLTDRFRNDDAEGHSTSYRYRDFTIGSGANLSTLNGSILVEGRYDYLTETMTTTRSTSSLQLTQGGMSADVTDLSCIDSYTGLWDTAPFTMECNLAFTSSSLGGSINAVTTKTFRGVGGESRPTSGELLITGANNSKTLFNAQEDGKQVLVKWDEDGDDIYEGEVLRTWDDLKRDLLEWEKLV